MKSQWLFISVIVASVYGAYGASVLITAEGNDIGPKSCAHGPEYWCQNLETAKRCGAVKHCIQEVWQHIKLPEDKNEICDTCKEMVAEARAQLESNETQEEIREVLEGTCRIYFPIKILAQECIKYVDEFIPELIEMLVSRMDPQQVCATAGLCNANAIKQRMKLLSLAKPTFQLPTPSDCQDCKKFMQDIITDVQASPKGDVKSKLLKICSALPKYTRLCEMAVNQNFDEIYDFLNNHADAGQVCQLLGMCDEITSIPTITSIIEVFIMKQNTDPECDFCQQIVLYLKNLLVANTTKEEFKDMLLGICKEFGSFEKQCEDFVNQNFDEIYDFITDELDPHAICAALGVCDNATKSVPWVELTSSKKSTGSGNINLSSNPEIQLVENAPFASQLGQLGKKVITKFPFSKASQILPNPEDMQLPETRLFPQAISNLQSPIPCALCEYALHELQNILMGNSTSEAIKQALEKVCDRLPKSLTNQCVDFIVIYGDAILTLIAQQLDPSVVCVQIKLCPQSKGEVLSPSDLQLPVERLMPHALAVSTLKSGSTCEICKYIVLLADAKLENNKTQEAIASVLSDICEAFPKEMDSRCKKFMKHYMSELIQMMENLSPDQVCQEMKVCAADAGVTQPTAQFKEIKIGTCDFCHMIVDYVAKLLEEQTVDDDITKVLEDVCNVVPSAAKDQCKSLIETYGPYILQLLGQMADSKKVCQAIDFCSRPPGTVHLIGGNKCTYGPSYWCQSKLHAKACKAEKHCTEKVWKN